MGGRLKLMDVWRAERHMEGKRGGGVGGWAWMWMWMDTWKRLEGEVWVGGSLKLSTYGGQKEQRAERTH